MPATNMPSSVAYGATFPKGEGFIAETFISVFP